MTPFLRLPLELLGEIALINIEDASAACTPGTLGRPFPASFSALPEREEPGDPRVITDPCLPFAACYTYCGAASNQATVCFMKQRPMDPIHINLYFVCRSIRIRLRYVPEIWRRVAFWYPLLLPQCIHWVSGTGISDVVSLTPFCLCVRPYLHKVIGHARRIQLTMPYDGSVRACDSIAWCLMDSNDKVEKLEMRFSLLDVVPFNAKPIMPVMCFPFPYLQSLNVLNSHLVGYGGSLRALSIGSETSCFRLPSHTLETILERSPNLEELCLQRALMTETLDTRWLVALPRLYNLCISDDLDNNEYFRNHVSFKTPCTSVDLVLGPHLAELEQVQESASRSARWAIGMSSVLSTAFRVASLCLTPHDGWEDFSPSPERIALILAQSCAEAAECFLPDRSTLRLSTSISKDVRDPHLEEQDAFAFDTFIHLFVMGIASEIDLSAVDTLMFSAPSADARSVQPYIPEFIATINILALFQNAETIVLPDITGPTTSLDPLYDALSCCSPATADRGPDQLVRSDFLYGRIRRLVFPNWAHAGFAPQRVIDDELDARGRPVAVGVVCETVL